LISTLKRKDKNKEKIMNRRNILKAALACVPLTPSQPEGPFYPIHEQLEKDFDMTTMNGLKVAKGEKVYIGGTVVE
jgi:protocatechuate 3,4-dioxygenase beta subunit